MIQNTGSTTLSRRPGKRSTIAVCVGLIVALSIAVSAVSIAWASSDGFPDVPQSHPYYAAIQDLADRNIIQGYPNGDFGPSSPVTRQQFAKMIVLTAGYSVSEADICGFPDVPVSGPGILYPDNYIAVAAAHGITLGKTATTFQPYANISRYQLITMVVRAADDLQQDLLLTPPPGWTGSAGWEDDAVHGANAAYAEYNGLLNGIGLAGLSPYGSATRGEVAQILHNLLTKLAPPTTTTTTGGSTTTVPVSTTTTASTTSTTVPGSTTTTVPAGSTTTTSTAPLMKTYYAVAGLEQNTVTHQVLDQFGRGMPNVSVYLTTSQTEGVGLTLLNNMLIGQTDGDGYVAYTWGQNAPGAWGVEQVTVTAGGISRLADTIQWIYNDAAGLPDYVSAVAGQQKVTIASGFAEWSGKTVQAYLNPAGSSLGSATYVSSAPLSLSTNTHTWVSGQGFFIGAQSADDDGKRNWIYNVVP